MTEGLSGGRQSQEGELSVYLRILRRWWWLLVIGPVLSGVVAFFVTQQIAPTYRATARLLINQVQQPGTLAYNDVLTSERLTQTYRELVRARPILETVVEKDPVGGLTADGLASKVSASVVTNTQLVDVSVTDQDPDRAAQLANILVITFVQQDSPVAPASSAATKIVQPAVAPGAPFSPNLKLNVALAVAAGLMIAGGVVFLLEYMDQTLSSPEVIEARIGLPTLGEIVRWRGSRGQFHLAQRGGTKSESEAYAVLRTNVQFSTVSKPVDVVLVTSASPGEGKSTTAANYALAVADADKRVALIDVDLRRPTLHQIFGLDNALGLTSALLKDAPVDAGILRQTFHPRLFVVTSGPLPPNPAELLEWSGFDAVLDQIKQQVDLVVLDSPPLLAVADARILAAKAGATMLVVDAHGARPKALSEAVQALQRANANVIGVVLNKMSKNKQSYKYYYYQSAQHGTGPGTNTKKGADWNGTGGPGAISGNGKATSDQLAPTTARPSGDASETGRR